MWRSGCFNCYSVGRTSALKGLDRIGGFKPCENISISYVHRIQKSGGNEASKVILSES